MDSDISFKETKSWFAYFVVMLICLDHERSSAMVTPKVFCGENTFQLYIMWMY